MKNRMVVLWMILVLGVLLGPAWGGEKKTHPQKEVKTVLTDLKKAVKGYKKYAMEREKARRTLEKDIQTVNDRKTTEDQIAMYKGRMADFKAEAKDDLAFLKAHSREMTQKQKEDAEGARESVNEAGDLDAMKF